MKSIISLINNGLDVSDKLVDRRFVGENDKGENESEPKEYGKRMRIM